MALASIISGIASFALPKLLNIVGDLGKSIVEGKPFLPALGTSLEKNILGINQAKERAFPIPTDSLRDKRTISLIEQALVKRLPKRIQPLAREALPLIRQAIPIIGRAIRPVLPQPIVRERPRAGIGKQRPSVFAPSVRRKRRRRRKGRKRKRKKKKKKKNLPAKRRISRAI